VRLYVDTADRALAEPLLATGLFAGVTTNPTILQRAGLGVDHIEHVYRWAVAAGAREVFLQTWGTEVGALVEQGLRLRGLGEAVVVKVPASRAGSAACAQLSAQRIPTLLTAVYSPAQAMVAAAAGATYLAPYLGQLNDQGRDGEAEVLAMHELLAATGSRTKVLVASVRDVRSMVSLARKGLDCFTMGPAIADELFADELTAAAVETFEQAVLASPAGTTTASATEVTTEGQR
jgi:TalC/MipB family fructose-6-phosphate aldolase